MGTLADFFISHASEDKDAVARPIAEALREHRYDVWYDEFSLKLGDSLPREIDRGLAACRYGVVILSHAFFSKEWPQRELDGLAARETMDRVKRILPVWHDITAEEIKKHSPTLAARFAVSTEHGIKFVVGKIVEAVQDQRKENTANANTGTNPSTNAPPSQPYRVKQAGDRLPRIMVPFQPPKGINIPPGYQTRLNYIAAETARESAVRNDDGTYSYPVHVHGESKAVESFVDELKQRFGVSSIATEASDDEIEVWFEYHGTVSPADMKALIQRHKLKIVQCGATLITSMKAGR